MKKWIVLLLVLGLAFVGCTKQAEQTAPEEAAQEAVESAKEAIPEEAPKAEAEVEDPDVKSCLQLVSETKFADALPVCLEALKKHPENEEGEENQGRRLRNRFQGSVLVVPVRQVGEEGLALPVAAAVAEGDAARVAAVGRANAQLQDRLLPAVEIEAAHVGGHLEPVGVAGRRVQVVDSRAGQ